MRTERCAHWSGWVGRFRHRWFPATKRRRVTSQRSDFSGETLALARDVRAAVHDDGLAVLDISTGKVFLANEIGSRIWRGVAAGLSLDRISAEISGEFGVGPELVRRHTSAFISELEERRLVVRRTVIH